MDINEALRKLLDWNTRTFRVLSIYLDAIPTHEGHVFAQFCRAGRIQNQSVFDAICKLEFVPADDEEIQFNEEKITEKKGIDKDIKWLEDQYGSDFKQDGNWFADFRRREDEFCKSDGEEGSVGTSGEPG